MPATKLLYVAEVPAVWHARPPLVVDCSVLAAQLFDELDAAQAGLVLRGRALHAPALLPFEFANVARSKSLAGASAEQLQPALLAFEELRVELHSAPARELHALALRYALTAYDAAYLWLAGALKAPLVTFDRRLSEAATQYLPTLD